jgi:preprotein translocase subunit SecD
VRRSLLVSLLGTVGVAVIFLAITIAQGNTPLLGLDLQGGASVVLKPQGKFDSGALNTAINIIRSRVDGLGVAEPNIQRQGNTIVVELPGVKNANEVLCLVKQTAELRFRPVLNTLPPENPALAGSQAASEQASSNLCNKTSSTTPTTTSTVPGETTTTLLGLNTTTTAAPTTTTAPATTTTGKPGATTTTVKPATTTTAPATTTTTTPADILTTPRQDDDPNKPVVLPQLNPDGTVQQRFQLGPTLLRGDVVSSASAVPPTGLASDWSVQVNFTGSGSTQFDKLAQLEYQKQVAIVLDSVVESAPTIQAQSFGGVASITGNFTQHQAQDLALILRYGSLPVQLVPETTQTVSASIGKDSLHAGILAGIIGLSLVLLYMILYYRALGLVVLAGLIVTGMLDWSIISTLSKTSGLALSLAGATGLIVSVGVTVDSYVVYFERLKDEIRSGKTVRSSVDRGFARAYRTIVAADLVSFIAAALLYLFSVGPVRGFAFFLGMATLLDLATAYCFTRPMVILLGRNRLFTEARWLGVARGLAVETGGPA